MLKIDINVDLICSDFQLNDLQHKFHCDRLLANVLALDQKCWSCQTLLNQNPTPIVSNQ